MTRRIETTPRPGRVPCRLAALLLIGLAATAPLLAATAEDLYTAALTREHDLRARADEPPTLAQLRDAMAAYTNIVRQYPRSGYSDNALWQAAGLAILVFDRNRQPADREAGARLLHMLEREYPSSSLVPRVAARLEHLRRLERPARIRAIRREPLTDVVRVTIELDSETRYTAERLDGPARLFFDFSATDTPSSLRNATLAFDDGDMVRRDPSRPSSRTDHACGPRHRGRRQLQRIRLVRPVSSHRRHRADRLHAGPSRDTGGTNISTGCG